jgi:hypothetical protein
VAKHTCLGIRVADQNCIHEEIRSRFDLGMLAIIQFRIFCLPVCNLKTQSLKYRSIILLIVLYGCETWFLTLREEHRLRVLKRIFGPKGDELRMGWRKLHEELCSLYSLLNIIKMIISRRMRWADHVACMGKVRNKYTVLIGKPEVTRPLRRPKHRWEDDFKMNLTKIG